ncbi:hypothetical protein BDZ88DRAFT_406463 [Geranomyces variabilis]|nr:hypothetical protein BDZ88DRAFT_406463 [Geranomyces variabilis]KAJ3139604.1 hypothetical protein HDU90_009105 [Geranomyces variabilis]
MSPLLVSAPSFGLALVAGLALVHSPAAQAAPAASPNSQCFYPSADSVCGAAFAGYPIYVKASDTNATNVIDSNLKLSALANAWSAPADIARLVANTTGCLTNTALLTDAAKAVRYQASVWCSAAVAQTLLTTNCVAKAATQPGQTTPAVLCAAQCKIASDTMQAVWSNTTICPKPVGPQAELQTAKRAGYLSIYQNFNKDYPSYCDYANFAIQTAKAVCYDGLPDNAGGALCGYATAELAANQCATNTADPCCGALLESIKTNKPFVKPSAIGTDDGGSKTRSIIITVGIVIVGLIGAAVGAYFCFRGRDRRRKTKADKFRKNSSNNNTFFRFNDEQSSVPPVPPLPQNLRHGNEKAAEINNSSYHQEQPSPNVQDGWNPCANEKYHVQEPQSAYRGDIPLSPMPSPTRSHPQAGQANNISQNTQPGAYEQARSVQPSVAPPVTMAAPPRGDYSNPQPSRSPWDAPVVTAQPAPPPSVSSEATPPSEDGSDILNIPMRVLHHYVPTLTDELPLQAGTEIIMVKCFDDGWALGVNPHTGQTGAFPLVCVAASENVEHTFAPVALAAAERARSPAIDRVSDMTFAKRVSSQQYLSRVDLTQLAAISTSDRMMGGVRSSATGSGAGESFPSIRPAEKTSASFRALGTPLPRESFGTLPAHAQSAAPVSMLAFPEPPRVQPFVVGSDHEDDFDQPPNQRRTIIEPAQPPPSAPARNVIPPPRLTVPPPATSEPAVAAAPAGPFDDHHRIDHDEPPAGPAPTLPELSLGSIGFDLGAAAAEEPHTAYPSVVEGEDDSTNPFKNA